MSKTPNALLPIPHISKRRKKVPPYPVKLYATAGGLLDWVWISLRLVPHIW
jgi:hypothetical protein